MPNSILSRISVQRLAIVALLTALAPPSQAMDGANFASSTYYESVVEGSSAEALSSSAPGLPTHLAISDSEATARYVPGRSRGRALDWTLEVRGLIRSHERVDAVYHVIAVLPLPVDPDGRAAFKTRGRGIVPREGSKAASVPLIYGGEKITLKRNVSLEKSFLAGVIGSGVGQLPDLLGTGYEYTLWDTIVRYDPSYGDTIQIFADVSYATDEDVAPPDAADDRLKAYVVTWIPDLDSSVAPFAVRIDVEPAP